MGASPAEQTYCRQTRAILPRSPFLVASSLDSKYRRANVLGEYLRDILRPAELVIVGPANPDGRAFRFAAIY